MDPLLGLYSYARPTRIYRKQKNRPPFVFRNFFLFLLAVWRCWYVSYAQLDSIIRIVYEFYIPHFLRLENRIWRNKCFFEIVRNKDRVINLIKRLMGICFFFFYLEFETMQYTKEFYFIRFLHGKPHGWFYLGHSAQNTKFKLHAL